MVRPGARVGNGEELEHPAVMIGADVDQTVLAVEAFEKGAADWVVFALSGVDSQMPTGRARRMGRSARPERARHPGGARPHGLPGPARA
jgi:hypothetical protein